MNNDNTGFSDNDLSALEAEIREAVAQGTHVQDTVHRLTLKAMNAQHIDLDALQRIVAAVLRGVHDGAQQRLQLVTFPVGVRIIPNPFNRIPGFMVNEHYFVPGFPQMAHPMIEWALDTFYASLFQPVAGRVEKALLLTGPTAYESALLDLMERIVKDYPALRLFSLPSLVGKERKHLELGVEGSPELVDKAMEDIRVEVEKRGNSWTWRP